MSRHSILTAALLIGSGLAVAKTAPKVLVIYDMEGITGTQDVSYIRFGDKNYAQGRRSLTDDINAAVRGLSAGGAGAIWIEDGHGSGNFDEPDLLVDRLDKRATFDFRTRPFDAYSSGIDGSIDAIVIIGTHARAGSKGFLPHTYTFDVSWNVNGVALTEFQIAALSAAPFGIPIIMASGDDVLEKELAPEFPDLEYARVKTAMSPMKAEPIARDEASRRIETAARRAMAKFLEGKYWPYYLPAPYTFHLRFRTVEEASFAVRTRGVSPDGDYGVWFTSPAFLAGFTIALEAIGRALNPLPLLVRLLEREPDGQKILDQWKKEQFDRLLPEMLPAWEQSPPLPPSPQKYWGGR